MSTVSSQKAIYSGISPKSRFFQSAAFSFGLNHFYSAKVNKWSTLLRSALLKWEREKKENLRSVRESTSALQIVPEVAKCYGEAQVSFPAPTSAVNVRSQSLSHYLPKWKELPGNRSHPSQSDLPLFSCSCEKRLN